MAIYPLRDVGCRHGLARIAFKKQACQTQGWVLFSADTFGPPQNEHKEARLQWQNFGALAETFSWRVLDRMFSQ